MIFISGLIQFFCINYAIFYVVFHAAAWLCDLTEKWEEEFEKEATVEEIAKILDRNLK